MWDTQDEDSMDPLLNISDGFDAQVGQQLGILPALQLVNAGDSR